MLVLVSQSRVEIIVESGCSIRSLVSCKKKLSPRQEMLKIYILFYFFYAVIYDGVSGFVNSSLCSTNTKCDAKPNTVLICYQRSPLGSKFHKLKLRSWINNHFQSEKYRINEEMCNFRKERFGNFYRSDLFLIVTMMGTFETT